jgi:phosphatidylserine decarboxylase
LQSPSFGRYALIEVGALCVGKIVQTGPKEGPVLKGQEKGYFLFGASTVIAILPPGRLICDRDLITNTRAGLETWVPLGDRLGEAKHP